MNVRVRVLMVRVCVRRSHKLRLSSGVKHLPSASSIHLSHTVSAHRPSTSSQFTRHEGAAELSTPSKRAFVQ